MSLPIFKDIELDEYCTKLLAAFILEQETYRFNQFQRYIEEKGIKISKPALIHHLNHLVQKELIIRNEKEKQNVTYRFNSEKWENTDQLIRERAFSGKQLEKEMEEFSKRPIFDQVMYANDMIAMMTLLALRENIVKQIKPEKAFIANINLIYFNNISGKLLSMILNNVEKKGKKYTNEYLKSIDRLIAIYVDAMENYSKREKGIYKVIP